MSKICKESATLKHNLSNGFYVVNLGESFHMSTYLQISASTQPRTSLVKIASSVYRSHRWLPKAKDEAKVRSYQEANGPMPKFSSPFDANGLARQGVIDDPAVQGMSGALTRIQL